MVVFLTDGHNQLAAELEKIYSKFNVIGFGANFNVSILENLVKAGTQPGVISCNLDEAFTKISQKF